MDSVTAVGDTNGDPQSGPHSSRNVAHESTPLLTREGAGAPDFSAHARKFRRQRWISFCLAFVLVALVVVLALVFGVLRSHNMHAANALCLTPACIHAASEILYNLSPGYQRIDPCANFQELVCDGWRDRHNMRPDQGSLNTFTIMAEDGQTILRHILEAPYPRGSNVSSYAQTQFNTIDIDSVKHAEFSPTRLASRSNNIDRENFAAMQRAYNACMAETEISKVGIAPVQNMLAELSEILSSGNLGLEANKVDRDRKRNDISEAILYLEKLDIAHLLSFGVGPDDKNPDTVVIFASPRPGIGLPSKAYYSKQDVVTQYQSTMSQVFKAVLPNNTTSGAAENLAAAVVALESQIAAITPELEDLRDVTKAYNPMLLKDVASLVPILGLDHVLKSLAPSNYTIDTIITSFPSFFGKVSEILKATSPEALQGFFSWKIIQGTFTWVEASEIKPYTWFLNELAGKERDAKTDRWRTCVGHVDSSLGWILSRFYVEAAFSAKAKDLGQQIVSDIKEQFINKLEDLDWMDKKVKKLATDKVHAIVQKIGYPAKSPNIMDPSSLKGHYGGLDIGPSYFDNRLAISEWTVNESWTALGKPTNRDAWEMTASTVNAYYNPAGNEIVFPAGIMQFPVFGSDLPKYINYGAFGAVAGHELSHAFDNNGRHYDVRGNFRDWWTEHTIEGFEARAECFVDEYSNFTVAGPNGTELHVNGRQTLGENIADAGGLSAAFSAWEKRRREYPDEDLPGLDFFSQEQLFYVSYGSFWCSKYTQQALQRSVYTDEHSPNFARIIGAAMLNSRGFRQAFECPDRKPVCELW